MSGNSAMTPADRAEPWKAGPSPRIGNGKRAGEATQIYILLYYIIYNIYKIYTIYNLYNTYNMYNIYNIYNI